ncbi:hypothetical protein [Vibrio sp. MA40-2]|uniref:hypothetical protein n=1 Tax=Vibrio sp. MA40-2 TaxID=3391828 RepID=UPI0039A57E16
MYKIFALFFLSIGVYLGLNYSNEMMSIIDSDIFEQVRQHVEEGKNSLMDKIDEIKGT